MHRARAVLRRTVTAEEIASEELPVNAAGAKTSDN
ncbi:hypothetical protein SAMN05421548_12826 [Paraburkholderia lycopersici]|uniref:Uncharacterized protein n=1 Tax=Paraburkholderia lycopersici TaxID=416944 RepID=A0A1G6YMW6_9BURK|nr:hypothetical protein SAMN05421548_12826 [Paraburkholderia lycopersici]